MNVSLLTMDPSHIVEFWDLSIHWVSFQTLAILPLRKDSSVTTEQEARWAPEPVRKYGNIWDI
jgi:hypothetical protein